MSPDSLVLYFDAALDSGLGSFDIYRTTRPTAGDAFGEPVLVANLNSSGADRFPWLTRDMLTLYFESDRSPNAGLDIMVATRTGLAAEFEPPRRVEGINGDGRDDIGSLTADGRTLHFSSARTGNDDLYFATLNSAGGFDPPRALAALNTDVSEGSPVITADGLTIYFSRPVAGQQDTSIYAAHRTTISDGFGEPTERTDLSTIDSIDFVNWVSADNCTMLLSSDRLRQDVQYDLFIATRHVIAAQ